MNRRFITAAIAISALAVGGSMLGCGEEKGATTAPPDVSAQPDPAARCLALAAQEKWNEALTPCREAAGLEPDDPRIKHAVQQAQAAAAN